MVFSGVRILGHHQNYERRLADYYDLHADKFKSQPTSRPSTKTKIMTDLRQIG